MDGKSDIAPFLRWAGGKRWLVDLTAPILARIKFPSYHEPFLGSGAFFFGIGNNSSYLSDTNSDLINCYETLRDFPYQVWEAINKIPNSSQRYYFMRSWMPATKVDRTVRFLYLNKFGFNGLFRTNKNGIFNVPYGGLGRSIGQLSDLSYIELISKKLRNVTLYVADFGDAISLAGAGGLLYCDPAYTVAHNNNGFNRYNKKVFAWTDQIRLRDAIFSAAQRGAMCLVSNAAHTSIRKLYHPWKPLILERGSRIGVSSSRGIAKEYLFVISNDKSFRRKFADLGSRG